MRLPTLFPLTLSIAAAIAAPALAAGGDEPLPSASLQPGDLDPSVSACTDLNAFVNGKWLAANPVPADRTTWGSFEILGERSLAIQHKLVQEAAAGARPGSIEAKLGDIWSTGMDQAAVDAAGIAPLQPQLARIEQVRDSAGVAAYLRQAYAAGQGPLFSFGANADYKDSGQVIAYAGQGGLGLPEKGYYVEPAHAKIREAYVQYIARLLTLSGVDAAQAAAQAKAVMEFETRLAQASLSRIELRDPARRYNPVSLAEAERIIPSLDWTAFFDTLQVPAPAHFSLGQPQYFAELESMLARVPASTWRAYLRFHAVDDAAPYLGQAFEQANFDFYSRTLRGQQEMLPRWKRVLAATNTAMGEALGKLYVQDAFPAQSKEQMQHLVQNLSVALKARLQNLDWMSEQTKQRALEKWASFTPKIGYPDKWRDWSGLQTTRSSFLANMQTARAFNYRYMLDKIGKPVDRTEWGMTPQTVNAYYNATKNEIVFPAAILQAPFFDPEADPALNYGGIGAVIGHEMMHGYDDSGSQFDAQGNFDNWWTEGDRKRFDERTDKLVAQFDGYEALPGLHVKGRLTLGENIGDLGGLTVAYDALQVALKEDPAANVQVDGYSQDQRFFMNWATVWRRNFTDGELRVRLNTDPHAPANFRANGAPSNMPAFAQAFQCKAGDAMVRPDKDRVVIW
ncbi:M13-type metalloendopeptidase [Stenotrophomonas sp. MMGLT7]|uniref:M13 family metallopeptidase n=1 Tax=Stenotrophomonas sp. MMGLT7 TaxID=2901227 RepID=UPI001E32B046|nr:M13-type metalloendopeptidase [Stenotrophomonas sp. MMGLT7]MCD7099727.1 peptidase [Stenotrophomonas sp. MMGLT7]